MSKIITTSASIFVQFVAPGFHRWPEAPDHRDYLRSVHRHLFYVKIRMPVKNDNREIEFHDLLDYAKQQFKPPEGGPASCEMLARELAEDICGAFTRPCFVSVSEDDECGAEVGAIP